MATVTKRGIAVAIAAMIAFPCEQARAQDGSDISTLRKELAELKAIQAQTAQRINAVESALEQIAPSQSEVPTTALPQTVAVASAPALTPRPAADKSPPRLAVGGDLRVRYEMNTGDSTVRDRHRWAMRGRLRASYRVLDWLTAGTQLTTGDPDDPKSSDVTLSGFINDFQVNLDQAYLQAQLGHLQIMAGKFPNPYTRTELLWDNDVSPQGASAAFTVPIGSDLSARLTGSYFVIDEASTGPDSKMIGAQARLMGSLSPTIKFEAAGAYYSFALDSAANASRPLDVRSNLWDPTSRRYLSDFELLDLYASATYEGFGARWPVRLVGDYVHNFGAVNGENSGFEIDLIVGQTAQKGDWRFTYGYSQAETDAVLAAVSQDSTTLATNYRQHTVIVDHMLAKGLQLSGYLYRYKPLDIVPGAGRMPWINRIRIAVMASF